MAPEDQGGGWWPEGRKDEPRTPKPERKPAAGAKPPQGLASGGRSRQAPSRYSLFVGIAFFVLIIVALVNLIGNNDAGIAGAGSGNEGEPLIEFAAVDARADIEGDANIAQDDCESSRKPCPEEEQRQPACEVEDPAAIRVCDFFDQPLAISFWFTKGGDCTPAQDEFDRVAQRLEGRANFLSVNIRDDRETVLGLIESQGWEVPVGRDPDGAVSNLYRVGICPTLFLAYPGGILYDVHAPYAPEEIEGFVEDLIKASAERQATSR